MGVSNDNEFVSKIEHMAMGGLLDLSRLEYRNLI